MKTLAALLTILLFCLSASLSSVQAQTASNSAGNSAARPSANRFSDAPAGTSVTPVTSGRTTAAARKQAVQKDQWYTLALATFLSLRYLFWILGFAAAFCILSLAFAHMSYRNHQPQSAHGVARWSVFWALLVCSLLPWLLPLLSPFYFAWSWIAWMLVSFPFTVMMLILLVILLTNRPVRAS